MPATFLKVPNAILVDILTDIIRNAWGNAGPGNMSVCLYQGNHIPAAGDTAATYTSIEATFNGYVRVMINSAVWPAPTLIGNGAFTLAPACTYTHSLVFDAGNTIWGYFVLNPAGNLAWAQLLPVPIPVLLPGNLVTFQPQYSYLSQH